MTRTFDRDAFLKEWEKASQPIPGYDFKRQFGEAAVTLLKEPFETSEVRLDEHEVYLDSIYVGPDSCRKGHYSKAMGFVTKLATKHGIDLVLHAAGIDSHSPADEVLVAMYKKHGFIRCGKNYNEMFRPAYPEPAIPA